MPGFERRTLLKGAAVAGAAGLAAPLLAETGARAASGTPTKLVYGANHDHYGQFTGVITKGTHGYRVYADTVFDTVDQMPTAWPSDLPTNYMTWSLRPNLVNLLHGDFDDAIVGLLRMAPDHAELTIWHEAGPGMNGPGNNYAQYGYVDEYHIYHGHLHMQGLCSNNLDRSGGHVKYGSIIAGPANQMQGWLGRNLDWYGVDIYDNPNLQTGGAPDQTKINNRMDDNLTTWNVVCPDHQPSIRIPESNSPVDANRAPFWLYLSEWMVANNGFRLLTFWKKDGPDSGDWPPSQDVINYWNNTLEPDFGAGFGRA
jgi:hypothetical protein